MGLAVFGSLKIGLEAPCRLENEIRQIDSRLLKTSYSRVIDPKPE